MKLSSTTLALSLLSFNNVFYLSSGFKQQVVAAPSSSSSTPLDRRMRMLQRAESRNAASQRRTKQNGQKNGGGGGGNPNLGVGGGGPGNSNNDKGDKSGQGNSKGYGGKRIVEQHSAHLDTNDAGITTDKIEYTYGEPIVVTFDLTNELVSDEVLSTLDVSTMSEWKIGLYMRMARPQDGALDPIVGVSPTFTENVNVGRMLLEQQHEEQPQQQQQQRGKLRGLQDVVTTVVPTSTGVTSTGATSVPPPEEEEEPQDDVTDEDEPQGPPPTLNYVGSATFTTTDIETLNPNLYGNGFDIYLIDNDGRQVIGPATLYELKSPEMLAADEVKANEKAKEMNKNGLMKFNHAKVKHQYGKGGSAKGGAKGSASPFGITSKSMGKGSGVDGGQILGTTEALATYVLTTNAEYYTLGDEVIVTYDISQDVSEGRRRLQNGKNGNGNGNGNGNNNKEPVVVETTTSSTTTGGDDETSPPTTTTPPEPVIDMSAGDNDMAAPVEIDPDDLHLYSLGIYMRMAHPQGGDLPPIISMPFCTTEDCDGKTITDLQSGTFTLSTNDLDTAEYGTGYDAWILNGLGHGIAGPYTFYVEEEASTE